MGKEHSIGEFYAKARALDLLNLIKYLITAIDSPAPTHATDPPCRKLHQILTFLTIPPRPIDPPRHRPTAQG
ncbi:MAG: hypothetical protein F6K28_01795 [Microcoleus sp. SIO2G3]|nr:hypothetical protein [Microcoleus sp. SIO2G3]